MAAPPSEAGAVQETVLWVLALDVAVTLVGAPGTVDGTTEFELDDEILIPTLFVAVTVNV
jgi:hypothetical protein